MKNQTAVRKPNPVERTLLDNGASFLTSGHTGDGSEIALWLHQKTGSVVVTRLAPPADPAARSVFDTFVPVSKSAQWCANVAAILAYLDGPTGLPNLRALADAALHLALDAEHARKSGDQETHDNLVQVAHWLEAACE